MFKVHQGTPTNNTTITHTKSINRANRKISGPGTFPLPNTNIPDVPADT